MNGYSQRPIGASVLMCCHNSAARVASTLEHLARQRVHFKWEVLLVNNACSDGTVDVARNVWAANGQPAPLKVIDEPRLGLTNARQAGLGQARYRYAIFCDDDNWLGSNYVQTAIDVMESQPHVGVLGGLNHPHSDIALPDWFWECAGDYAVGAQAAASGDITARGYVWGAGLTLRNCVYERLCAAGARPILVDRTGTSLASGGDAELCHWFVIAGFALWYDDRLSLSHFLPSQRLTPEYHCRLMDGFRQASQVLERYQAVVEAIATRSALMRTLRLLRACARVLGGCSAARLSVQAFNPMPWIVVDSLTRRVQINATAIRASI